MHGAFRQRIHPPSKSNLFYLDLRVAQMLYCVVHS